MASVSKPAGLPVAQPVHEQEVPVVRVAERFVNARSSEMSFVIFATTNMISFRNGALVVQRDGEGSQPLSPRDRFEYHGRRVVFGMLGEGALLVLSLIEAAGRAVFGVGVLIWARAAHPDENRKNYWTSVSFGSAWLAMGNAAVCAKAFVQNFQTWNSGEGLQYEPLYPASLRPDADYFARFLRPAPVQEEARAEELVYQPPKPQPKPTPSAPPASNSV